MDEIPQGDLRLLDHKVARTLLGCTEVARVGYIAVDGAPRVVPMMFAWSGTELVLCAFTNTFKIKALTARPEIAVSIDTLAMTPHSLNLRGRAALTISEGIGPEFTEVNARYLGPELTAIRVAEAERLGLSTARIVLRPSWVSVIDFSTRFPGNRNADNFRDTHFAV